MWSDDFPAYDYNIYIYYTYAYIRLYTTHRDTYKYMWSIEMLELIMWVSAYRCSLLLCALNVSFILC